MRARSSVRGPLAQLLVGVLLVPALALGQDAARMCVSTLSGDRAANFGNLSFDRDRVLRTAEGWLRLDTNVTAANPESGLVIPFDQQVSVSYVFESGGATWSFGYVLYGDLVARGYVNLNDVADRTDDTLVDANGNGIADFHEDLYNLRDPAARSYVGVTPRCTQTWTYDRTGGGAHTLRVPELATGEGCGANRQVDDGRTQVGRMPGTGGLGSGFTDRGLYAHVPNLLEPRHALNEQEGLGHLVFLNADDDEDTDTAGVAAMPPARDTSSNADGNLWGVPDYNVSAYDADGVLRTEQNPDRDPSSGISTFDRTVDLGTFSAGQELVFFLVTYFQELEPSCLATRADGTCDLALRTPVAVHFSKSLLNLDLNPDADAVVASMDLGCNYPLTCSALGLQGWLDSGALERLDSPAYGNLRLATERRDVPRPSNGRMPHVVVGAPSNDPFRWIIGFEDLTGGGDRDFNDVVFLVNRRNAGGATSGLVSSAIPVEVAEDYTITTVRFTREDDATSCPDGRTPPCWHAHPSYPNACVDANPSLSYRVAVDCMVRDGDRWVENPSPRWQTVSFPAPVAGERTQTVELDMMDLGVTGSRLCWAATFESANQYCQPTIKNVSVQYQAVRRGEYARASVTPAANAVFWGSREVPGLATQLSRRPYDRSPAGTPGCNATDTSACPKDASTRGHLHMATLYAPEMPATTQVHRRWDAGDVLSRWAAGPDDPGERNLLTRGTGGALTPLATEAADDAETSRLFPAPGTRNLCDVRANGRPVYDLDRNGTCDAGDRSFLRGWLQGWERREPAALRAWPMGGFDLSTPAFVSSAGEAADTPTLAGRPAWYRHATPTERAAYRSRFVDRFDDRRAMVYVGSTTGFLHAFEAGALRWGDDACTGPLELRGHFARAATAACTEAVAQRNYGTGAERFAYLPGTMLDRYVNLYLGYRPGAMLEDADETQPSVNASPSVADVDLGGAGPAWTYSSTPGVGAKTVLVATTGKVQDTVFGLDVSDPDAPVSLFEYRLGEGSLATFLAQSAATSGAAKVWAPDTRGSRHSPAVVRMRFAGLTPEVRWVAVVTTDYVPNENTAGAVYFLDLATGRPVASSTQPHLGVVTLTDNEGVSGEPLVLDVDRDGVWDVVYVSTTGGRIHRIRPGRAGSSVLGRQLDTCSAIAHVPTSLDDALQRVHSPLAGRVTDAGTVQLFLGTGDNPDVTDTAAQNYHVLGFEDGSPLGAACAEASLLFASTLPRAGTSGTGPPERVWGGVTADDRNVYAATAVGDTAQPCGLDAEHLGRLYTIPITTAGQVAAAPAGASLGGHAVSTPVVYDGHLFVPNLEGAPRVHGGGWNNGNSSRPGGSRVLMFDIRTDGRLPR